jgi:Bacterial RNA polymerase, alpha chain C terminal domain/Sigma-70, region 4
VSQWREVKQTFDHDCRLACRFWRRLRRRKPGDRLFPEMRLHEVLDERELTVIAHRFIYMDTLRVTGETVGIGMERVRQIERQALVKAVRAWRQQKWLTRPVKLDTPIAHFPMSTRLHSCLWCEGILTVSDLIQFDKKYFQRIPNMGRKTQNELFDWMTQVGLRFRDDNEPERERIKRSSNRWQTEGAW